MKTQVIHYSKNKNSRDESNREILRPYKNKRLYFEGVYINAIPPSKKSGKNYGLVFASVYAPNENIEIDHAIISVTRSQYINTPIDDYSRYGFTAEVEKYYKRDYIIGLPAQTEHFMLTNINVLKMELLRKSSIAQPTKYINNRIDNVLSSRNVIPTHTKEELLDMIHNIKNDGSVEEFINEYSSKFKHKKVTRHDIVDMLYRNQNIRSD